MKKSLAIALGAIFLVGLAATPALAKKHHRKHHKKHHHAQAANQQ